MKSWPHSLLWRTFLLIALVMVLSVASWLALFRAHEQEPRSRHLAQLIISVVNLTRSAIINAAPDKRHALLRYLSDNEGIRIYPFNPNDRIAPLEDDEFLQRVLEHLHSELGPHTRLTMTRNEEHAVYVSFSIDGSSEDEYWLALPRKRIEPIFHWQWLRWGIAALLLSLLSAYLIVHRVSRRLQSIAHAAQDIGHGVQPQPIQESGPSEIADVARAVNQMASNLAQLDSDRRLILAGISHDLRTPLTRLRMAFELIQSQCDDPLAQATREGMIADVEEMDQTIGQFLDFARESSGEPMVQTDLALLLGELVTQYARRNINLAADLAALPPLQTRPQALRRAVTNLIDNALRHAEGSPVALVLRAVEGSVQIEINDNGPGIPLDQAERLKQPFTRLENARSNPSGAGLGLAIVNRIVKGHGGTLQLLPRATGGLTARIVLPTA
jgi:two-component system osmolarity sensor histidine kinase EnvZ